MDSLKVFLLCFVVVCVAQGDVVSTLLHLRQRDVRESQQEVEVAPEQSVLLPCHSPTSEDIQVFTWTRPDLRSDGYVYFYRNKRSYQNYQLPSFQGRVELRDPDMKDGDVSVVLKNVTVDDAGTYSCYVSMGNLRGSKVTHSEMCHLTVNPHSGETPEGLRDRLEDLGEKLQEMWKGETAAALLALTAVVVVLVVVLVVVVVVKCLRGKPHVDHPKL